MHCLTLFSLLLALATIVGPDLARCLLATS